jgi:endonuclease YncB( thermonuclease family)
LLALEANAKYKKLGLWGLPEEDRVEPWLWRQQQREKVE